MPLMAGGLSDTYLILRLFHDNPTTPRFVQQGGVQRRHHPEPTTMPCLLEDWTPYDQSVQWRIHHRYFGERGLGAWQDGEVPWYQTNNAAIAGDSAELLLALVLAQQDAGQLSSADSVVVLEVGAGIGHFAANFCTHLAERSGQAGKALLQRLTYLFSDYAESSVRQALATPALEPWVKRGVVQPAHYDLRTPALLRHLDRPDPPPPVTLVIASYVCDVMPCKILQRQENQWMQQVVRVLAPGHAEGTDPDELLAQLLQRTPTADVRSEIAVDYDWQATDLQQIFQDDDRAVLEATVAGLDEVTLAYHGPFYTFLREVGPVLAKGGAVLVHDYGPVSKQRLRGRIEKRPSTYGNSLSHEVPFAVLDAFAAQAGWQLQRTVDPLASLQTALLRRDVRESRQIQRDFQRIFEAQHGEQLVDHGLAARHFADQKQFSVAARFYRRALQDDPKNLDLLYKFADACLDAALPEVAQPALLQGQALDLQHRHDFEFQIGRSYAQLSEYESAIAWYQRSLQHDDHAVTHTNLGAIYEQQGKLGEAYREFRTAQLIDPSYTRAQERLERLRDQWWQTTVAEFEPVPLDWPASPPDPAT